MARRRPATGPEGGDVMPRHLVDCKGLSAGAYRDAIRERNAWLRAHGIDLGDWPELGAALRAARTAYGIPDAVERHRLRLQVADTTGGPGGHP